MSLFWADYNKAYCARFIQFYFQLENFLFPYDSKNIEHYHPGNNKQKQDGNAQQFLPYISGFLMDFMLE